MITGPQHAQRIINRASFRELVRRLVVTVPLVCARFSDADTLACCGATVTAVVGAVAYALNMPFIVVRKEGDNTQHDQVFARNNYTTVTRQVNGDLGGKGYLFIDDLVASGKTLSRVIREIDTEAKRQSNGARRGPQPVCALLYEDPNLGETERPWSVVRAFAVEGRGGIALPAAYVDYLLEEEA